MWLSRICQYPTSGSTTRSTELGHLALRPCIRSVHPDDATSRHCSSRLISRDGTDPPFASAWSSSGKTDVFAAQRVLLPRTQCIVGRKSSSSSLGRTESEECCRRENLGWSVSQEEEAAHPLIQYALAFGAEAHSCHLHPLVEYLHLCSTLLDVSYCKCLAWRFVVS